MTATGCRPVVAGKPEPPLHAESVERVGAKRPLVVGDRLDTDIEGAVRGGADSLLVLTGVTKPADLLLAPCPSTGRPTWPRDLTGLNASHPGVTVRGRQRFRCGGWTASRGWRRDVADRRPASGDWIDGLRALCAAPGGRRRASERAGCQAAQPAASSAKAAEAVLAPGHPG